MLVTRAASRASSARGLCSGGACWGRCVCDTDHLLYGGACVHKGTRENFFDLSSNVLNELLGATNGTTDGGGGDGGADSSASPGVNDTSLSLSDLADAAYTNLDGNSGEDKRPACSV